MSPAAVVLAAMLLGFTGAGSALAQNSPAPADGRRDAPVSTPAPPGVKGFNIRKDTPAERDAFLQLRAAEPGRKKPDEVPPLPAQIVSPRSRP